LPLASLSASDSEQLRRRVMLMHCFLAIRLLPLFLRSCAHPRSGSTCSLLRQVDCFAVFSRSFCNDEFADSVPYICVIFPGLSLQVPTVFRVCCFCSPCAGSGGCKNRPDLFPGRMSFKATKPGSYILACFFIALLSIRAPFYVLFVFVGMCSVFWLFWLSCQ